MVSSSCPFINSTAACKDWQSEVRLSQLEAKIDSLVQEVAVLKKSDVERKAELKGINPDIFGVISIADKIPEQYANLPILSP